MHKELPKGSSFIDWQIQAQVYMKQILFHSEQFIIFSSDCAILNIRTEVRIAKQIAIEKRTDTK